MEPGVKSQKVAKKTTISAVAGAVIASIIAVLLKNNVMGLSTGIEYGAMILFSVSIVAIAITVIVSIISKKQNQEKD